MIEENVSQINQSVFFLLIIESGTRGTHLDLERERPCSGDLDLDFDLDIESALDLERLLRRLRLRELRRLLVTKFFSSNTFSFFFLGPPATRSPRIFFFSSSDTLHFFSCSWFDTASHLACQTVAIFYRNFDARKTVTIWRVTAKTEFDNISSPIF